MTKKYPRSRILAFAREPNLGEVKTRLASTLGDKKARSLYLAMLERVGALLQAGELAGWDLWVTSNKSHQSFLSLCNRKNIHQQKGMDLGQKMNHAINTTLGRESVDSVLLIGTDCPAMDSSYLDKALAALHSGNDVVIGPAADGGYVLIGSRRPVAALFTNISWGSNQVLNETLVRLEAHALSYRLLDTLWDVDRPEDLPRLAQLRPPLYWE